MQWTVALIQIKNHCTGNEYLDLGQEKTTKDTKFIMNCARRLNLKTANAFLIGKLKTKILLPVWNSHKCILYEQSSPGQALKLKCMVKKKIRKLSHVFSTLQTQ